MKIYLNRTAQELGKQAAALTAQRLRAAIEEKGEARIVLSTGASQFTTLAALVQEDVAWDKVTAFHLDEYINLPVTHGASFRKYLKERFVDLVPLKEMVYVDTDGDTAASIQTVTDRLREKEVDIGLIGIGENTHIAFNDPPADFDTRDAYIIVHLDDKCRRQQVGEGWFATPEDVPACAVSMTPYQIMQCKCIISAVPFAVKAECICKLLSTDELTNLIPATLLKTHPDFHLFLDQDSASQCDASILEKYECIT